MTFNEAKKELEAYAKSLGEPYYSLDYHFVDNGFDEFAECQVYIHGYDHVKGKTWREALDKMKKSTEAPGEEFEILKPKDKNDGL